MTSTETVAQDAIYHELPGGEAEDAGASTASETPTQETPAEVQPDTTETQQTEDGTTEEPTKEQQEEHKRKSGIDRLKAKNAALEARLAALEAATKPAQTPQATPNGAPRMEDYEDFGAYNAALISYEVQQRLASVQQQQAEAQIQQTFKAKLDATTAAHPDFLDLLEDNPDVGKSPVLNRLLAKVDAPPALFYHLAANPDEARRIQSLPPEEMGLEIGLLKARLATPKPPPVSRAKPPIQPVTPTAPPARRARQEDAYTEF